MAPFDPITQKPEDYNIIHRWFRIFDKLFFSASLEKYCTLQMSPLNATTKYGVRRYNHRPYGRFDYTPTDVSCTIIIFRHWNVLDPAKQLNAYLATLIQEMIHAALEIYCCNCMEKKEQSKYNSPLRRVWSLQSLAKHSRQPKCCPWILRTRHRP